MKLTAFKLQRQHKDRLYSMYHLLHHVMVIEPFAPYFLTEDLYF